MIADLRKMVAEDILFKHYTEQVGHLADQIYSAYNRNFYQKCSSGNYERLAESGSLIDLLEPSDLAYLSLAARLSLHSTGILTGEKLTNELAESNMSVTEFENTFERIRTQIGIPFVSKRGKLYVINF